MDVYEFVNVEAGLIGVVRAAGTSSSVDIPNPRPTEFVQVSRVGGVARLVTESPMVQFIVWGGTWSSAFSLAARVRRIVHSVTVLEGQPIYRIREVGGLSRSPDPVDGSPRYQFTVEVQIRGFNAP